MDKPKFYLHNRWLIKNNIEAPTLFCNNRELTSKDIECFEETYGVSFKKASQESYIYNKLNLAANHTSYLWDKKALAETQDFIRRSIESISRRDNTSITPLLPFEIMLVCNGYKMTQFIELNRYHPMYRTYYNGINTIDIGYGITPVRGGFINFYFNLKGDVYQVDNDPENFNNAIAGKLPSLIR